MDNNYRFTAKKQVVAINKETGDRQIVSFGNSWYVLFSIFIIGPILVFFLSIFRKEFRSVFLNYLLYTLLALYIPIFLPYPLLFFITFYILGCIVVFKLANLSNLNWYIKKGYTFDDEGNPEAILFIDEANNYKRRWYFPFQ